MSESGRCYEDFQVGEVLRHPLGRTVTETDNTWFTLLTNNTNPIHFDRHYSAQTEFGRPLMNSTFTLALVVGLSVSDISRNAINLGWEAITLPNPVFYKGPDARFLGCNAAYEQAFGTTRSFLDYFGLKSLDQLPSLADLNDIPDIDPELPFAGLTAVPVNLPPPETGAESVAEVESDAIGIDPDAAAATPTDFDPTPAEPTEPGVAATEQPTS